MDYFGLLWITNDCHARAKQDLKRLACHNDHASVYYGLLWGVTMDYYGLLWITMDYYGLLWSTEDYYARAKQDLKRLACHNDHAFVYVLCLLKALQLEPGGSGLARLSQVRFQHIT